MPFQAKQVSLRLFSLPACALTSALQAARSPFLLRRPPSHSASLPGTRFASIPPFSLFPLPFHTTSSSLHETVVPRTFSRPGLCLLTVPFPAPAAHSPSLPDSSCSPRTLLRFARLFFPSAVLPSCASCRLFPWFPCSPRSASKTKILCDATDHSSSACVLRRSANATLKKNI